MSSRAHHSPAPSAGGAIEAAPGEELVRCGAELVAFTERFYGTVFRGAAVFVGLAALAALALLPVRPVEPRHGLLTPVVLLTLLVAVAAPLAVWRAPTLYRLLRRRPGLQLGLVLIAAALVADSPLSGELWWPSCAMLIALSVLVRPRRALAYCLAVLAANLAGHVAAVGVDELPVVAITGLWIGYPLWTMSVAIATELMAAYLMRLNATGTLRRPPPRRVRSWTRTGAEPEREPAPVAAVGLPPLSSCAELDAPREADAGDTRRLTARQLQVVALLADGLRYREVAACLSISVRQVQRHVAEAVDRLGVRNAYELAALAVADGIVPAGKRPLP